MINDQGLKDQLSFSIFAELIEVRKISEWLTEVQTTFSLETKFISKVDLALAEMCNNIISHGYKSETEDTSDKSLQLEASHSEGFLRIQIKDSAPQYSLPEILAPDPENPTVHGYGLMIVEQLTDTFSVERVEDQNVWNLIFKQ